MNKVENLNKKRMPKKFSTRWEKRDETKELGCCGQLIKFCLVTVNVLFLVLGLVVFISAAVLKWGNGVFSKFTDIPGISELVNVSKIDGVSIFLLVLGGFIMLLSFMGLIGVKYLSKPFLVTYGFLVLIMFLAHLIALVVLLFSSSPIETQYMKALNKTMTDINEVKDFKKNCDIFKGLSEVFKCCGLEGPNDFTNKTVILTCCEPNKDKVPYESGCGQKSIDDIKKNAINLLFIPSGIILVIELFAVVMVPFLIGRRG